MTECRVNLSLLLMSAFDVSLTQAATISVINVHSDKMNRDIPATIILPDSYALNEKQKFPVLYLLHGAGGVAGN